MLDLTHFMFGPGAVARFDNMERITKKICCSVDHTLDVQNLDRQYFHQILFSFTPA
jgi:hypothetical protein